MRGLPWALFLKLNLILCFSTSFSITSAFLCGLLGKKLFVCYKLRFSNCFLEKELGEIDGDVSFWPVEDLSLSSIDWLSITMWELSEVVPLYVFVNFRYRSFTLYCSYWWGFSFSFDRHIFFSALRISFSCLSWFSPGRGYTFPHLSVQCILSWDDLTKNTKK